MKFTSMLFENTKMNFIGQLLYTHMHCKVTANHGTTVGINLDLFLGLLHLQFLVICSM